ncbi:VCBS repeat-containing protein [Pseudoalteromonas sp. SR41-8]|uniref:FG-GAP repeat domain-containing protein n=1 Tax=Pseudoalteromonas sp. SR41-8 TaxID=2760946 RepID=UPI0016015C71|nr:VCBS repeat-containing protein [Pseudoalteromonas sp. SR41-8]MBB1311446.1 VCBS repeat-containing protein [Pseudoalteromonas sp. SR41-8]
MIKLSCFTLLMMSAYSVNATDAEHLQNTQENTYGDAVLVNGQKINFDKSHFDSLTTKAKLSTPSKNNTSFQTATNNQNIELTSVFRDFSLDNSMGQKGLYVTALTGLNSMHIISAQQSSFNIIEYTKDEYQVTARYDFDSSIQDTALLKDNVTDTYYLYVLEGKFLKKVNLVTQKVELSTELTFDYYNADSVDAFDINNDGKDEIIVYRNNELLVLNALDLSELAALKNAQQKFVLGSFTQANVKEILFSDGAVFRFENDTFVLHKQLNLNASGEHLIAVDINNDGLDEVINGQSWKSIEMLSPSTEKVLWTAQSGQDIDKVIVADINKDGIDDLVYGDGQWGQLYALSLTTGIEFWSIKNPGHGVSGIVVDDFNGDGKQDIAWGAGYSSSGEDEFQIHNVDDKTKQWSKKIKQYSNKSLALADINNNGSLDVLYTLTDSNSLYVVDTKTKTRILTNIELKNDWDSNTLITTADLFNDGKNYIISGSSAIYDANVQVFSPDSGEEIFQTKLGSGDYVSALTAFDINNDGKLEIIVGNGAEHTGSEGNFFKVLNGQTGEVLKISPSLGFSWRGMSSIVTGSFINNDNIDIVSLVDGSLVGYDYSNNTIMKVTLSQSFNGLVNVIANGEQSLVASSSSGSLYKVALNGQETLIAEVCQGTLNNLVSVRAGFVQYSCSDQFGEYDLDNNTISYRIDRANEASWLASTTFNNVDYTLLSGKSLEVFSNQTAVPLTKPDNISYSGHVLSSIQIDLPVADDIDYVVLDQRPTLGKVEFSDRKAGLLTYVPSGVATGTDVLNYYTVKGRARSAVASLTLDLTNTAPVANNMTLQTHWNTPLNFNLEGLDEDEENLVFDIKNTPAHGQIQLIDAASGSVTFSPSGESLEPVSVSYTVRDSLIETQIHNVVIEFKNTTPQAQNLTYKTSYNSEVNGRFSALDNDDDTIEYELVTEPNSGSFSFEADTGLFKLTPTEEESHTITFSYIAKDKFASSATQTVTVNVEGKQGAPSSESSSSSGGGIYYLIALLSFSLLGRRRQIYRK